MKFKQSLFVLLTILTLLPVLAICSEQTQDAVVNASMSENWLKSALEQVQRDEYSPSLQISDYKGEQFSKPRYHFVNRVKNLRAYFDEDGIELMPRIIDKKDTWELKYRLNSIYRTKNDTKSFYGVNPEISDKKIVYQHQGVTIEYTNSKGGIEQTILILEKQKGEGNLFIKVNLETHNLLLTQNSYDRIIFSNNEDRVIYQIKKVVDAERKILNSQISYDEDAQFTISVDDKDATYPIYINLLVSSNNEQNGKGVYIGKNSISGLSQIPDWTAESDSSLAQFGYSVSTAGDVNGDGYSDVIIGAPYYDGGQNEEGHAFVYHGSASGLSSTPDWTAESDQAIARFGHSVSTTGDVNGDGYSDVIVGTPYYDNPQNNEGRAYVYHGSASGLSSTPNWTEEPDQAGAYLGISVSTAGDVNGDGYSDVIVGAYCYDNGQNNEGRAYVYHGSASGLSTTADWTAESDQESAYFGISVSTAGDVNGDGYSDVIVGAREYDGGQTNEGRVYVYHGGALGLSSTPDWTAESDQADAWFGHSVSTAGDVNGDGYSDVIIGAYRYDNGHTNEGRAFVYHGNSSGLSITADWTAESDQLNAYFGVSVSTAGDVNGDGYSDVIVGADYYDNGQTNEGGAFVYHGSVSGLSLTPGWTAESDQIEARFGQSVSTAGDVNGDGYSDVVVGAPRYDNPQTNEGGAFVYHGGASGLSPIADWTAESDSSLAQFGHSVSTAGDVNGDGYSDAIIGAPYYDGGQTEEGRAFVYHGSASGLSLTADWTAESDQALARFGHSVSTAGDVNGDGYSDVIVGIPYYDNPQNNEGCAYVYYGNSSGGLSLVPKQAVFDDLHLVQLLNATGSNEVRLKIFGKTPGGRGKVKLQWEIKELGQLMNETNLGISSDWYDTDTGGIEIAENISGLQDSTAYHWRVRLQYSPLTYDGSIYSRWLSIGPNGMNETDFITTALSGIEDEHSDLPDGFILSINTPVSNVGFSIRYCIPEKEAVSARTSVSIKVYDKSGRLVKTLFEGRKLAGSYEAEWKGDDGKARKVPSGVYFIYLRCGEYKGIKKAIFIR